jgi:hypothetical protein
MSDRLLVATRKGLFRLERKRSGWTADLIGFVGNPVTNALRQDDGVMFAALKLGHFGPKLHRSDDDGRTWREIADRHLPPTRRVSRRCSRSGLSKAAGRITRTVCGSAPFPPGCFAPTIAARAGSS